MVVNCYRLDSDVQQLQEDLREHRTRDDVAYALMDYDQSIQLPAGVSVKDCRRPSHEAEMGADIYKPLDVWLGEPEYNPFAFDVGMLGNLFRSHLSVRIATLLCSPSVHPPPAGRSQRGRGDGPHQRVHERHRGSRPDGLPALGVRLRGRASGLVASVVPSGRVGKPTEFCSLSCRCDRPR